MRLHGETAEVFVPDGSPAEAALSRTTHLGVSAHQDDLEIMAFPGILECFQRDDLWFTGVSVTDGSGSPRDGAYRDYTDQQMQLVRRAEQKKAAMIGGYSAQILLDHPSSAVKDPASPVVVEDLQAVLRATSPTTVFTHNLADKHDTHVAVAVRVDPGPARSGREPTAAQGVRLRSVARSGLDGRRPEGCLRRFGA